ncbi:MAG: small multi-drug export protein [Candidatus Celaenobacter polaris]|nr:small multi-drug export protein [Candidatus Celaenobacter polaris]
MEKIRFLTFFLIILLVLPVFLSSDEPLDEPRKQAKFSKFLKDKNLSDEAVVVLLATLPIFELRGAIPWAIHHYNMPWYKAYLLGVFGNFLPIPLILLILKYGLDLLSRIPFFRKFFEWLFARTRRKGALIQKYEAFGLILFVMIPLPVTGAWTGSIAAYVFGIKFFPALLCILIGICIAGIIVTILSMFGIWGALIAIIALLTLFILWLIKFIKALKATRNNEKGATE